MATWTTLEPLELEPYSSSVDVCGIDRLEPDRGVCALVDDKAVAIFRLSRSGELAAVDNIDPFTGASVLSRGLVGTTRIEDRWCAYVASPLRKQRFDLRNGQCLDDPAICLDVYPAWVEQGRVRVARWG